MKKLFIVGVSSFIGSNVANELKDRYSVSGTYFRHPVSMTGVTVYPNFLDLGREFEADLASLRPDAILFSAGTIDEIKIANNEPDVIAGNLHLPL